MGSGRQHGLGAIAGAATPPNLQFQGPAPRGISRREARPRRHQSLKTTCASVKTSVLTAEAHISNLLRLQVFTGLITRKNV